jgi:hypothetical protein
VWDEGVDPDELMAGTYTYTVIDAQGCEQPGTLSIDEPEAMAVFIDTNNEVLWASAEGGTPPYIFVWTLPSGNSEEGATHTPDANGVFSVQLTDANGCSAEASYDVDFVTSVSESFNSPQLRVFPNPTADFLTIRFTKSLVTIRINDIAGRCVFNHDVRCVASPYTISVAQLATGTYTVSGTDLHGIEHKGLRFIIAR